MISATWQFDHFLIMGLRPLKTKSGGGIDIVMWLISHG